MCRLLFTLTKALQSGICHDTPDCRQTCRPPEMRQLRLCQHMPGLCSRSTGYATWSEPCSAQQPSARQSAVVPCGRCIGSYLSERGSVQADGRREAPDDAVAEDAGSRSSQGGLEEDDVAVRLLSPAAEAPVDELFEAEFAALMETHQVGLASYCCAWCRPTTCNGIHCEPQTQASRAGTAATNSGSWQVQL